MHLLVCLTEPIVRTGVHGTHHRRRGQLDAREHRRRSRRRIGRPVPRCRPRHPRHCGSVPGTRPRCGRASARAAECASTPDRADDVSRSARSGNRSCPLTTASRSGPTDATCGWPISISDHSPGSLVGAAGGTARAQVANMLLYGSANETSTARSSPECRVARTRDRQATGAVLRPRLRAGVHTVHCADGCQSHLDGDRLRNARTCGALVGVVGLRVVDEPRRTRGGLGSDRDVGRDGRSDRRRAVCTGGVRRPSARFRDRLRSSAVGKHRSLPHRQPPTHPAFAVGWSAMRSALRPWSACSWPRRSSTVPHKQRCGW